MQGNTKPQVQKQKSMLLILERIQNRDMKMNKGLEHLSYGERLGCNWSLSSIPTQVILWFYDHQVLFYWEDDWVLAQGSQRSWGTSLFETIQNLSGKHPEQGALSGPAWADLLWSYDLQIYLLQLFFNFLILLLNYFSMYHSFSASMHTLKFCSFILENLSRGMMGIDLSSSQLLSEVFF